LILSCDASKIAFGACLTTLDKDGKKYPVMFVSKKTSDAEENYSNTERELASIVWALNRLEYLISGMTLKVETDHQPLVAIIKGDTKNSEITNRCVRLLKKLSPWLSRDIEITYIKGKQNPADLLSRPKDVSSPINVISSVDKLFFNEIKKSQMIDAETHEILSDIADGNDQNNKYKLIKKDDVLCLLEERDNTKLFRLFIPRSCRQKALEILHGISHWGISAMKRMARKKMFWQGMNKDIEDYSQKCDICKVKGPGKLFKESLHETPIPPRPWYTVAIDLVSLPATSKGFLHVLTIIDMFTRFVITIPLKNKLSKTIAEKLSNVFSIQFLGSPVILLSDQGAEFVANIVDKLCKREGITQKFTAPYNPKANGTGW